jgi:uncharacterized membrane protein
MSTAPEPLRVATRWLLAAFMVAIGVAHFADPEPFVRIVPPYLPAPYALVLISGAFEVLGGLGLLVPATRRFSSLGLIALYVAVFPANVYMATHGVQPLPDSPVEPWMAWARLPFQAVLIAVAWWVGKSEGAPVVREAA